MKLNLAFCAQIIHHLLSPWTLQKTARTQITKHEIHVLIIHSLTLVLDFLWIIVDDIIYLLICNFLKLFLVFLMQLIIGNFELDLVLVLKFIRIICFLSLSVPGWWVLWLIVTLLLLNLLLLSLFSILLVTISFRIS